MKRFVGADELVGFARFNLKTIGVRIATARHLKNLTQVELAGLVGVSRREVIRWESGHIIPSLNSLACVADACDATIPYLLGYEGYDEPMRVFTGEIPYRTVGPGVLGDVQAKLEKSRIKQAKARRKGA